MAFELKIEQEKYYNSQSMRKDSELTRMSPNFTDSDPVEAPVATDSDVRGTKLSPGIMILPAPTLPKKSSVKKSLREEFDMQGITHLQTQLLQAYTIERKLAKSCWVAQVWSWLAPLIAARGTASAKIWNRTNFSLIGVVEEQIPSLHEAELL